MYRSAEDLFSNSELSLESVHSANFEGAGDISRIDISASNHKGDLRDYHYLDRDLVPRKFQAQFKFYDFLLTAQVMNERVHVRSSQDDLKDLPQSEQMIIAVAFARTIFESANRFMNNNSSP